MEIKKKEFLQKIICFPDTGTYAKKKLLFLVQQLFLKFRNILWFTQVQILEICCFSFKVCSRMCAARTLFRCLLSFESVSAVAAYPALFFL